MKINYLFLFLLTLTSVLAQNGAPAAYYNGFDFNLNGMALKDALATKITQTHTHLLSYQDAEDAIKIIDVDPTDSENLFLVYGFSNTICPTDVSGHKDHRKRNKNDDGTGACQWNREHTFAKSLGNPSLGDDGPGSDAHHIRPSDVDRNSDRASRKFTAGSGNSNFVGSFWYPGDEWKGDIARMMMYMYLRYGDQCKPNYVCVGATNSVDANMIDTLLLWNAEDPVTEMEDFRNTYLGDANNTYGQGNRNPFIDNPYLATVIWGGPIAENRWPTVFLSNETFDWSGSIAVFPNPTRDGRVQIISNNIIETIEIINLNGQLIQKILNPTSIDKTYTVENLPKGFYFLKVEANQQTTTKKIVVN
ncbi:T9SS type A sorting domain-containing protein [Flavobacterium sp. CYK-4]|uniref:endonuclease n=1 Tax=Flavobacterium lotistagni TaxID=2709660 RepID=UPI001407445E|nr:endonuclease [Flavobacterium lotistagni]NHM07065.1 T9SS type A sorting domain-containing protein [Flavobacterium lotistagni]